MNKLSFLYLIAILALCSCKSTQQSNSSNVIEQLEEAIQTKHPITYFELAGQLLNQSKMNEAVVWYYVGQIRFRAYLMANPDLDPSGDPALYSSLKYVLGTPINEYAGSDPYNWVKLIENAINWHKQNPNSFTPKDKYPKIYSEIEKGFGEFRDQVASSKEEVLKQRTAHGLKNS